MSALLPIETVVGDAVRLRGGRLRAILECPTLAFGIKGDIERRAVVDGWSALLNSLAHPIQVVIRTRRVDPNRLAPLPGRPDLPRLRDAYRRLVTSLAERREVVDRRYFVVVPHGPSAQRSRRSAEGLETLEQRVRWLTEALRRLDLEPRRLAAHEVVDVLRGSLDPATAWQPIASDDPLLGIADLVSPAALAERSDMLELGARRARSLAVVRYPSQLQPGWLGDLATFDSDLDLALHIAPSAGGAAMSFLERRIAELSSTVRASEERGARIDPYRRVALADAIALRDELAQGSQRLFDTTLAFTVWADSSDELEARTRGLEALLGTRLIHTRRLLFQMRAGLVTTLPLGDNAIESPRVLSTEALAATFPFSGNDVQGSGGVLYGVNATTKSAVVLDRFSLENHNAVVFATSGAGKSYLVKVELARAMLLGARCLVIDPEGEYTSLLASMGALVVPVRPGMATGIDAFALPSDSPGTLSVRIATLTTLVALLVGELSPEERAGVEEALAHAYARAGFTDGRATAGLVPPRLAAVQERLASQRSTERIAQLLARYVSGPSAWLFEAEDGLLPDDPSAVYVLAGLPEEARAAAMFLVLDRIWMSLARSTRPTLVVVDEAWWLMRHHDTAAFLFRLVKTARKRRAGLTLVTQDVSDVLAHPDGEAIVTNSALQILLKQAPQSLPRLAELFRLTAAEQSYLLGAQRGEALVIAQGRRVPLRVVATDEEARLIEGRARVA